MRGQGSTGREGRRGDGGWRGERGGAAACLQEAPGAEAGAGAGREARREGGGLRGRRHSRETEVWAAEGREGRKERKVEVMAWARAQTDSPRSGETCMMSHLYPASSYKEETPHPYGREGLHHHDDGSLTCTLHPPTRRRHRTPMAGRDCTTKMMAHSPVPCILRHHILVAGHLSGTNRGGEGRGPLWLNDTIEYGGIASWSVGTIPVLWLTESQ